MSSPKISVGILGATGVVGQNYIRLLQHHPWFEVTYLAASPSSAGKKYHEAVEGRWHMNIPVPEAISSLIVHDASIVEQAVGQCALLFSAVDMDKKALSALELAYADKGFAVVSNNSAHRHTNDVPMILPEINSKHLDIIPLQRKHYGWSNGCLVVKPNCSIQSYMTPVFALMQAGYKVKTMVVTTLQALSGAGYPGPSAFDMIDNVVPYIKGEEEKSEIEPLKIFGSIVDGNIVSANAPIISAHCNRVPVIDGHLACVSLAFDGEKPASEDEIITIWRDFRGLPQELGLPSAPVPPLEYRDEVNRPQPRKDRDAGNAMAVVVGRLRRCNVVDYRFVGLHHNTVRGAAGGCILSAELLKSMGYIY